MNEQEYKIVKELRSDLFYQIEAKHGAKKAYEYPSIIKADNLIDDYNSQHSLHDWIDNKKGKGEISVRLYKMLNNCDYEYVEDLLKIEWGAKSNIHKLRNIGTRSVEEFNELVMEDFPELLK